MTLPLAPTTDEVRRQGGPGAGAGTGADSSLKVTAKVTAPPLQIQPLCGELPATTWTSYQEELASGRRPELTIGTILIFTPESALPKWDSPEDARAFAPKVALLRRRLCDDESEESKHLALLPPSPTPGAEKPTPDLISVSVPRDINVAKSIPPHSPLQASQLGDSPSARSESTGVSGADSALNDDDHTEAKPLGDEEEAEDDSLFGDDGQDETDPVLADDELPVVELALPPVPLPNPTPQPAPSCDHWACDHSSPLHVVHSALHDRRTAVDMYGDNVAFQRLWAPLPTDITTFRRLWIDAPPNNGARRSAKVTRRSFERWARDHLTGRPMVAVEYATMPSTSSATLAEHYMALRLMASLEWPDRRAYSSKLTTARALHSSVRSLLRPWCRDCYDQCTDRSAKDDLVKLDDECQTMEIELFRFRLRFPSSTDLKKPVGTRATKEAASRVASTKSPKHDGQGDAKGISSPRTRMRLGSPNVIGSVQPFQQPTGASSGPSTGITWQRLQPPCAGTGPGQKALSYRQQHHQETYPVPPSRPASNPAPAVENPFNRLLSVQLTQNGSWEAQDGGITAGVLLNGQQFAVGQYPLHQQSYPVSLQQTVRPVSAPDNRTEIKQGLGVNSSSAIVPPLCQSQSTLSQQLQLPLQQPLPQRLGLQPDQWNLAQRPRSAPQEQQLQAPPASATAQPSPLSTTYLQSSPHIQVVHHPGSQLATSHQPHIRVPGQTPHANEMQHPQARKRSRAPPPLQGEDNSYPSARLAQPQQVQHAQGQPSFQATAGPGPSTVMYQQQSELGLGYPTEPAAKRRRVDSEAQVSQSLWPQQPEYNQSAPYQQHQYLPQDLQPQPMYTAPIFCQAPITHQQPQLQPYYQHQYQPLPLGYGLPQQPPAMPQLAVPLQGNTVLWGLSPNETEVLTPNTFAPPMNQIDPNTQPSATDAYSLAQPGPLGQPGMDLCGAPLSYGMAQSSQSDTYALPDSGHPLQSVHPASIAHAQSQHVSADNTPTPSAYPTPTLAHRTQMPSPSSSQSATQGSETNIAHPPSTSATNVLSEEDVDLILSSMPGFDFSVPVAAATFDVESVDWLARLPDIDFGTDAPVTEGSEGSDASTPVASRLLSLGENSLASFEASGSIASSPGTAEGEEESSSLVTEETEPPKSPQTTPRADAAAPSPRLTTELVDGTSVRFITIFLTTGTRRELRIPVPDHLSDEQALRYGAQFGAFGSTLSTVPTMGAEEEQGE